MNKISKCKCCGNYELRLKLFENKQCKNNFSELDLYFCRAADWKWCKLKNNWCYHRSYYNNNICNFNINILRRLVDEEKIYIQNNETLTF